MSALITEKLARLLSECDKHLLRMNSAKAKAEPFLPLTIERFESLSEDEVEHIDQFLFRFAKLQDAIGQRLFKLILSFLQEDIDALPFIDILNRLEKLQLIESAQQWQHLREVRNEIAHQYEDQPQQATAALNAIFSISSQLEDIYQRLKQVYSERL